jgi:hypothetical protein
VHVLCCPRARRLTLAPRPARVLCCPQVWGKPGAGGQGLRIDSVASAKAWLAASREHSDVGPQEEALLASTFEQVGRAGAAAWAPAALNPARSCWPPAG